MNRFLSILAITVASGLGATSVAADDSERVTRGDALAVFEAFANGGFSVLNHDGGDAAPTDGLVAGKTVIRPFPFFDGKHYCALDWHVALIGLFEPGPRPQAEAALSAITPRFWIDGTLTATERTAVKRSLRFGNDGLFFVNEGVLLPPDALAIGTHTLRVQIVEEAFDSTVTFVIDAPGSGTCL